MRFYQFIVILCLTVGLAIVAPLLWAEEEASGITFTGSNDRVRMHMVGRLYDFTKDIAGIRAANEPGHQAHLLKFGQSVVASALLDNDGNRIGSLSISNIPSLEETHRYVYDDPFTQGGIYKEITIAPVDLYKVDGAYNRAPAWFAPELERRQKENGYDRPVKPTGNAPQPVMYLIRKDYAVRETVDEVIAQHRPAHLDHLRSHGRNVVSAAVKDKAGQSVASLAVGAYESWGDVVRFVYQDPYTLNGMFERISIETVDLYKLDGSYERAPSWFYEEMKRRQSAQIIP